MRISDWSSDVCSSDLVGVGDVVGGGEFPPAASAQQEGGVFGVVVAVAGHDVEGHAAEDFGVRVVAGFELPCNEEQLPVGVVAALVVVQVLHGAQRLNVVLAVNSEETTSELQSPIRIPSALS